MPIKNYRSRTTAQGGFTILELMIAGVLFLMCSLALFQLLDQSYLMAKRAMIRVTLNSEARNIFHTLADGGINNTNPANPVPGYHGHNRDPWTQELTINNHRLELRNATNTATLFSRDYPNSFVFNCAIVPPPQSCVNMNNQTIAGYVDQLAVQPQARSINNRTVEVSFNVMEPEQVFITMEKTLPQRDYSDSFWTVFTLGVDKREP